MVKIFLARHGQDQDNADGLLNGHRDTPLTDIGVEQASKLSEKIKNSDIIFNKVYSSPLQRAYRTAEKITDTLGLEKPDKLEMLIERDFGIMTGRSKSEIEVMCSPDILKTDSILYFLSPEGSETFPQLIIRAKELLNHLDIKHDNQNVLLVTHGDFGKMIYAAYYNLDWRQVLEMFHFGNSDLLLLSEDSDATNAHVFNIEQYNN